MKMLKRWSLVTSVIWTIEESLPKNVENRWIKWTIGALYEVHFLIYCLCFILMLSYPLLLTFEESSKTTWKPLLKVKSNTTVFACSALINKENLFCLLCWNYTLKCKVCWQRLEGYTLYNQGIWKELVTTKAFFANVPPKNDCGHQCPFFFNHADEHRYILMITQYGLSFSLNI